MLRYDGYYIEEPTEVYDGRSKKEKSSYLFNAYYFFDDKSLKISSKHNLLSNLLDFNKEDFDNASAIDKEINIRDNKIIMSKSFSFEKEVVFKIFDSDKIYNETFKKYMYFVSWLETKEGKKVNFKDTILYKLFSPFYHKKYEVYNE